MKIKKYVAGTGWVQEYPEVNVSSIVATGTPSSSTFLRGDGTWATPTDVDTNTFITSAAFNTSTGVLTITRNDAGSVTVDLDGKYAESSHTHTLANITDSGAAAAKGVVDSFSNAAIGTGTSLPTERDVYYGLVAVNGSSQSRATTIYAPTTSGSSYQTLRSSGSGAPVWVESFEEIGSSAVSVNSYATISFTSGMRNFYIEAQQDGTTGLYQIAKFTVTMENSYSLASNSSRYYRATWFNGSSALTITFQYYYSGTTFYIRHTGATLTIGYRLYNVK